MMKNADLERSMQKTIVLNGRSVEYELCRKRVKNINLRVKADGGVYVSAPPGLPVAVVEGFMRSRADLILRALDRFAAQTPRPGTLEDGVALAVLGTQRALRLERGDRNAARLGADYILLTVKDVSDEALKKRTLDALLGELCRETVTGLCDEAYPRFSRRGTARPEIKFRRMKSRWGSCAAAKGVLTFNTALVHAPLECVEYVVYHEFVHFLHQDHSPAFYACLAEYVPDWKTLRRRLADYGSYLR